MMNLQTWAEWVDQISTITGDGVVELRTRPGKGMTISVRWTREGTRMGYNHAITMHEMKAMYGALQPCVLDSITNAVRKMTLNGAMREPLERKVKRRVGWWVVFDEPNDEGEVPDGFFVDETRAAEFPGEPGWLPNHLVPCWIDD